MPGQRLAHRWVPGDPAALGDVDDLVALVASGGVVVLSGAGVSTDSGIPDYRTPDGGRRRGPSMTHQEFMGSEAARRRYWARSQVGYARLARARPNAIHRGLADLEAAGVVDAVVTQNVDGLHSAAGSRRVVDLHGRLDTVACTGCGDRTSRVELGLRLAALNPDAASDRLRRGAARMAPDGDADGVGDVERFRIAACRRCDGVLMPDIVFFGGTVPRARVTEAMDLVDGARVLLVLGSSLAVMSGYRFVRRAAHAQIPVAIVNRGRTRGDAEATLRLDAALGDVVPIVARRLRDGMAPSPRGELTDA